MAFVGHGLPDDTPVKSRVLANKLVPKSPMGYLSNIPHYVDSEVGFAYCVVDSMHASVK